MPPRPYIQKVLIVFDAQDDVEAREKGLQNLQSLKSHVQGKVTAATLRVLRTKEGPRKGPNRNLFREM